MASYGEQVLVRGLGFLAEKQAAIANNLANVNTTGFKKSRANFQDLLYETIRPAGGQTAAGNTVPEGIQIGHHTCDQQLADALTTMLR